MLCLKITIHRDVGRDWAREYARICSVQMQVSYKTGSTERSWGYLKIWLNPDTAEKLFMKKKRTVSADTATGELERCFGFKTQLILVGKGFWKICETLLIFDCIIGFNFNFILLINIRFDFIIYTQLRF